VNRQRHQTTVVSVANLKGGVGKTTTAVHLAAGLALRGDRGLIVDLDAQGSATSHLVDPSLEGPGAIEVVSGDVDVDDAALDTEIEGLRLLRWSGAPEATESLQERAAANPRALALALGDMEDPPAWVVVDTPPHVGATTQAAFAASDWILVPVNCEYLPILGLKQFNESLARIRMRLRIPARVLGYLLTQVDRRERITWEVEEILRRTFGSRVFRTMIRIDTKLKACPSHRTTIFQYENESGRARQDYTALVEEFVARLAEEEV